jgi:carbamoyltransferase
MVFNTENKLQKVDTLYLGFKPKYNLNIFEEESFKILDCDAKDVSKILLEEPVAIFQGRSEQGQRGLGNRSLLMNPTHNKCIEKINLIKKREWFRPFSCSILHEELNKWFIVDNDRNPFFMMFVFNAKENVKEKINNVLAKDGTCRLQSVTSKHNQNYHALLKEFFYLTKVPILLNTSLNLPGHPLVETVEDLKYTMLNSNLKYSYLPDINKLIIKNE